MRSKSDKTERIRPISDNFRHVLILVYDLFIPAIVIFLLFFEYGNGPVTLSYYVYYLSDAISPSMKAFLSFTTLNFMVKFILAIFTAGPFFIFRYSKYIRTYHAIYLSFISMAVLTDLIYLIHAVTGLWMKTVLVVLITGLSAAVFFLIRRLFVPGLRRWIKWTVMGVLICLIIGNIRFFTGARPIRPNVVHIILDTLRMKSFNEDTMPFLWSLKEKGVYFPNSYASSDNTVTSYNAIYYGRYPSHIGLEHGPFPAITFMEVLRTHEYHTAAISANGRFCIVNGFDKGIEDFYETWKTDNHVRHIQLMADYGLFDKFTIIEKYFRMYNKKIVNKTEFIDKKPLGHREYRYFNYEPAEVVNAFVRHVILKNSPVQPFCLFINYLDAHTPYLAPDSDKVTRVVQRLKTDLPDIYDKLGFEQMDAGDTLIFQQIMLMWNEVDSLQDKSLKDRFLTFCYEENINYLDRQMKHLFSFFEQEGLLKNTLFIITSDHGESLGEHDLYEHGNKRLYNSEIQVPLMMIFPEKLMPLITHRISDINTQSVDFFPTIADFLDIRTDADLNGQSLLPCIFGLADSSLNRAAIAEYTGVSTVIDSSFKLIVRDHLFELYHLTTDSNEENNLAAQLPGEVKRLREKMETLRRTMHQPPETFSSDLSDEVRYDAETLQLLRSIGYIK